jgi:hypothetical protein
MESFSNLVNTGCTSSPNYMNHANHTSSPNYLNNATSTPDSAETAVTNGAYETPVPVIDEPDNMGILQNFSDTFTCGELNTCCPETPNLKCGVTRYRNVRDQSKELADSFIAWDGKADNNLRDNCPLDGKVSMTQPLENKNLAVEVTYATHSATGEKQPLEMIITSDDGSVYSETEWYCCSGEIKNKNEIRKYTAENGQQITEQLKIHYDEQNGVFHYDEKVCTCDTCITPGTSATLGVSGGVNDTSITPVTNNIADTGNTTEMYHSFNSCNN